MLRGHPVGFRRKVLDLIEAGKAVGEIADQLGLSGQTIYNWRNLHQIDRGQRSGVSTAESAELAVARTRIREPETELAVTKRANELLKAQSDPKGGGGRRANRERGPPSRGDVPDRWCLSAAAALNDADEFKKVLELLEDLEKQGRFKDDVLIKILAAEALCEAGDLSKALELFDAVTTKGFRVSMSRRFAQLRVKLRRAQQAQLPGLEDRF